MDLETVTAHLEIRQALMRYTRGVDRAERAMMLSGFHPGATHVHGDHVGTAEEFVDWYIASKQNVEQAGIHHITNQYVEMVGKDKANVETYVIAIGRRHEADGVVVGLLSGRYVDEFELRDGEWRVSSRRAVMSDFTSADITGVPYPPNAAGGGYPEGRCNLTDASYETISPY